MPTDGRYHVEWGGTYEFLESANRRLMIVVPVVFAAILALLYLTFNNLLATRCASSRACRAFR